LERISLQAPEKIEAQDKTVPLKIDMSATAAPKPVAQGAH
jgi:hypothetical protein